MEPEQRGRASRASSTSSLGREVRCGCQFYKSDSLLPERRALLFRPSSRTMQQPPAVRCRSVSRLNRDVHTCDDSDPLTRPARNDDPRSLSATIGTIDAQGGERLIGISSVFFCFFSPLHRHTDIGRASGIGYTNRAKPRLAKTRRGYLRFARLAIDRKLGQLPNPLPSPVPPPSASRVFRVREYARTRTSSSSQERLLDMLR